MSINNDRKPVFIRIINTISEISGYLSGIALFAAALIIFYKVAVRYIFGSPTIWQTELSIYLLMFGAFVGAAYGLKHDAHVNVDIALMILPERIRKGLRIVTSFIGLVLTVFVAYRGWHMWWHATSEGWTSETLWGPPLTYPYFILPLGMTLVSLQFIVIIFEDIRRFKNGGDHANESAS
ncbi:MAG TPA: TRAP transporter small permease [Bacillales bacterium]|nr:TRAP transporter small permease [Bacillales bacterium]